jgi:hypothetical protein
MTLGRSSKIYLPAGECVIMISITVREKDLNELARTEVRNLPGALFAGTSPLLRPFMKKLEALLPQENKGRGDMILREELGELLGERYPTTSHHRLNLPGLLFLQSGPALQAASAILLQREHKLQIPDGSRTRRYIFHMSVAAIDADKEKIVVIFDMDRLPKREDGTCVLV